jgi:uncharacterized membrane protein YheB (UPF0754 family)
MIMSIDPGKRSELRATVSNVVAELVKQTVRQAVWDGLWQSEITWVDKRKLAEAWNTNLFEKMPENLVADFMSDGPSRQWLFVERAAVDRIRDKIRSCWGPKLRQLLSSDFYLPSSTIMAHVNPPVVCTLYFISHKRY